MEPSKLVRRRSSSIGGQISSRHVGHWMERAACHSADLALFFPRGGKGHHNATVRAKEICSGCPVLDECREHALEHYEFGTWGGLTFAERSRLKKERRNAEAEFEDADA